MFVGKVIGTVWSTVKWPQLTGHKLLVVRPYHLGDLMEKNGAPVTLPPAPDAAAHEAVVCVDLLDAGVGDDVVVAFGHAARVAAQAHQASLQAGAAAPSGSAGQAAQTTTPIDAAVVAIVDGYALTPPAAR